jgi:DNA-binding response OmpR family regulator
VIGEVEIRPDQFQAFVGGVSADLTRREFELIQLLADAQGQVMQREEIYQRVWGLRDGPRRPLGRRLRAQAAPEARAGVTGWRYIHTHFGIGYRFAAESVDTVAEAPVAPAVLHAPVAGRRARRG